MQNSDSNNVFMKGPKRKRLAKACDACHKSKRRCDGTAPCSNCYYASKQCTYTDASGRPVPAPRPFKPERQDPQASSSGSDSRSFPASQLSSSSANQFRIYPNPPPPSHLYQNDTPDDEHKHTRKRFRNERGDAMPVEDLVIDGPITSVSMDRPATIELDPSLTRELTNLFFTHCHPARAILHKPTFSTALSHNRVPSHLLLAVCALAAPLSKQPRIRTTPSRFAGKPFAQEALSEMFDGAGRLVVKPDLETAQALCILQMHDILTNERNTLWSSRFHDLALQIVEGLGVHSPEHPTLTPVPSPEFVQASIEREALRRIFWFIHLLDVLASIFFKKPTTFADVELRLRLPVDETSFELGTHSTLPEYLYLPAVRTQYSSEFGHLIRILSIYAKIECALDEGNDFATVANSAGALMDAEQKMEEWDRTLPDHLRFSEQNLQVQQSMFETSSNTGAWCWGCIHVFHASCALALNLARQRSQRGSRSEPSWALERIELILEMFGDRAKNSILMGSALWSLIKYCKRDDTVVRKWAGDYEEAVGTRIFELVQDWRSQPSPPQQHQYLLHSHSQPTQHVQQQHQPHSHTHSNAYNEQQLSHRRMSDTRNPGSNTQANFSHSSTSASRPHHATDIPSYSGSSSTSSQVLKRSPSNSPPMSYPLGRPPNSGVSSNNNMNRTAMTMTQHVSGGHSDPLTNGNNNGRVQSSTGSVLLQTSGNNSSSNESSTSSRKLSIPGKYTGRDGNTNPSRWTTSSDSAGSVDIGMQSEYLGSSGEASCPLSSDSNGSPTAAGSATATGGLKDGGNSSQRHFTSLGDGIQSLPSLKASGLLDSWGSRAVDLQNQTPSTISQKSNPATSPLRTTPPGNINLSAIASHHSSLHSHSEGTDLRAHTTLAMPVGLQWLANESR